MKWYRNWTFHNIVAHPVCEILHLLGFDEAGTWVHDVTVPAPVSIPTPDSESEDK